MSDLTGVRNLLDRVHGQVNHLVSEVAIFGHRFEDMLRRTERLESDSRGAVSDKDLAGLVLRLEKLEAADGGHDSRIRELESQATAGRQSLSLFIKVALSVGGALGTAGLGLAVYLLQRGSIE